MLEVAIARRDFGATRVLAEVAFRIRKGELAALLAPSGTGKSTTLRIAAGIDRVAEASARRPAGRLGMAFQEPRLLPWRDVAGNLRFVAPRLTDTEIATLLLRVGLPEAAGLMPRALSLGMARRVALARALAVRPSCLLLDEPFASLDPELGRAMARVVREETKRLDAATLIATHDLDLALLCADRLLILDGKPATLALDNSTAEWIRTGGQTKFRFLAEGA